VEPFLPDGCGWQHRAARLGTSSPRANFENTLSSSFGEQGTSPQPLDQRQLYLRLITKRGGEADLQGVVTLYHLRAGA
jgi:hypothetical protein